MAIMRKDGAAPETAMAAEESVTTVIPAAMLGGQEVAPGDIVQLEVVSVDSETGDVTARYAMSEETPEAGGIDEMAAVFEKG